jgi:hypothetical protein
MIILYNFIWTFVFIQYIASSTLFSSFTYSSLNFIPDIFESDSNKGPKRFICRNVPGYGSCLFYALASCISYDHFKVHLDFTTKLRKLAESLRHKAVDILRSDREKIYLENNESLSAKELLNMVSKYNNVSTDDYCENMLKSNTWGSGTEIVALSNYLKRPIHVYELKPHRPILFFPFNKFRLKLCAGFGSPTFKDKSPYYILCADGRFPHVNPGQQKEPGDHFLALFPVNDKTYDGLKYEILNDKNKYTSKNRLKTSFFLRKRNNHKHVDLNKNIGQLYLEKIADNNFNPNIDISSLINFEEYLPD